MTKSKIFIDSSFWLAFFNKEDSLHQRSLSLSQNELFSQAHLFTSDYVIDETLTRLKTKVSAQAAFLFFESLKKKINYDQLILLLTNQEVFDRAYRIFKACPTPKTFSFTDATILANMKINKIKYLLTFDGDFKKVKLKVKLII